MGRCSGKATRKLNRKKKTSAFKKAGKNGNRTAHKTKRGATLEESVFTQRELGGTIESGGTLLRVSGKNRIEWGRCKKEKEVTRVKGGTNRVKKDPVQEKLQTIKSLKRRTNAEKKPANIKKKNNGGKKTIGWKTLGRLILRPQWVWGKSHGGGLS